MNFLKILLFALLAFILFFVYLEAEKTDSSVRVSQLGTSNNGHIIYRDGKQMRISNKEYAKLKAIPSVNAKNTIEEITESSEIKTLKLSGSIPNGVSYTIKVFYESESKGYICGKSAFSFGIFREKSGFYLTESTKIATYYPNIKDSIHSIEIPLDKFRPLVGCSYKLNFIQMQITNSNLQNNNVNYAGYFNLFFPKGQSYNHITIGSPHNYRVGQILNVECSATSLNDDSSYFHPNCHFKSTTNSFFTVQELAYPKYELNINTITQDKYELKRFFKNEEYTSRVRFIERISLFPKFYGKDLNYFTQKREQLASYNHRIDRYLQGIKKGLINIDKQKLLNEDLKFLEHRLKTLERSIKSQEKVKEIQQELLYDTSNTNELDTLNSKITINKFFLDNEFYKYEMLHLINISRKDPNLLYHKMYKLRQEQEKVKDSFSSSFLNCRKSSNTFCEQFKKITNSQKAIEKRELLKNIRAIETLLFLNNKRNLHRYLRSI